MTDLEALKARLRERAVFARSEGNATAIGDALHFDEAADAIERLEAETIALTTYRENLRDECRELLANVKRLEAENAKLRDALMQGLEFVEHHSSRWDGRAGPHPNDIVSAARAALKG